MITLFGYGLIEIGVAITATLVFIGMFLTFARLLLGPSLPDRVIALDLMSVLMVAFMALFTILTGNAAFLDVAISMALVAFLGTVAFARFAERQTRARKGKPDEGGRVPNAVVPTEGAKHD